MNTSSYKKYPVFIKVGKAHNSRIRTTKEKPMSETVETPQYSTQATPPKDRDALLRQAEQIISNVLRGGVLLSAGIIFLGLILLLIKGPGNGDFPHTIPETWQSIVQLNPYGVIVLGLIVLLFTPVLRVMVAVIAFAIEGDRQYVTITLFVLLILLFSIIVLGAMANANIPAHESSTNLEFFSLIFASSLIAGLIGALVGLGGGVLVVPILTLAFHMPINIAIGASIVSVIATSSGAAAAYVRDHLTNLRVGMFLEIATTLGAITGALVVAVIPTQALFVIFGAVLLISAAPLVIKLGEELPQHVTNDRFAKQLSLASSYPDAKLGLVEYQVTHVPAGFSMMYVAGLISGLLGIGSGTFKVLAMDTAMKLPMKVSSTTSNFMIGVTAAASAGIYFQRGDIDPMIAAPVALGVLIGALVGAKTLTKLTNSTIRKIFVPVLAIVAIEMLLRGFFNI